MIVLQLHDAPCHRCGQPAAWYFGDGHGADLTLPCKCGLPPGDHVDRHAVQRMIDQYRADHCLR